MNDRVVALVDMDCFYCQVETRLNPSLKGKPMAVVQYNQWKGGGIIAVNYEARDMGVTRHMRGDEAKKHCPEIQLVSVPAVRGKADLTKYRDAGREVIKVICEFSEVVQRASVDEAYIDLTEVVAQRLAKHTKVTSAQLENTFVVGYSPDSSNDEGARSVGVDTWLGEVYGCSLSDPLLHKLATATALVEEMRAAVYDRTGFRCSAGIAHNKILAKLVAGMHKPNRQTVLPPASVRELYSSLPLKKVRNLGGKLGDDVVERLGITLMSELANFTEKQLQAKYDDKTGTWLYNIARGIDLDPVTPRLVSKSIGCCKKFPGVTSLRTKTNVTHWLSELATEVAERLDEDIHMNKRKAQLLTIHFSQEVDGRDVAMSRSVAFPGYESERIAGCAFRVLSKHNCANPTSDAWHPPLKYLGLSAGKFTDYSGNSVGSIDNFFKVKPSTSKLIDAEVTSSKADPPLVNDDVSGKCDSNTKETTKDDEQGGKTSFFERYFKNQPNKIVKCSPREGNVSEDRNNKIDDPSKSVEKVIINHVPTIVESKHINQKDPFKSQVKEPTVKSEESWISPSEIFPDLENIDDSIMGILPSPLQRKISKMKEIKNTSSSTCNVKSSCSRYSTESDCAPTIVETVVDIHPSSAMPNVPTTTSKCVIQVKKQTDGSEEDLIESESVFQTSPDMFDRADQQTSASEECSYCKQQISIYELQEHLDHHVALELQEQWNKQPQNNRTASKETKTLKPVVASEKKKRGRPSKKDIVAPKKLRTIVSFFTKS
ncbi:DNA polymerase eta-like [Macrosteles quadrilineatus]|uniref:DNA polymerase eta-like n=1 Tax=Macrosteles quadrilineatus TaxID=74068 RepID=UPI0023E0C653|nr:DNA polymerase eta-like [Macrosteles quadrilineatus]